MSLCPGADIPVNWPDKGDIEFRGVSLRYYTNDSVIHKLNLRIPYGQKVSEIQGQIHGL